ncbi:hypothetical protein GNI_065410 [Gregarina niphandrodes]|uniref:Uncharacterized protein n=1 Tax=Gregarina niphandrodes TaxID=110365 RepID=A0A023B7X5_GRENI|nr:hypothetical protein GNI_065410 [Gregarina niphandrodes]EZG67934.1 hypothetical protein GNI_065410 [Gregarina niphandrodes]|eukprot:XP_011130133.1 hypothetical protein GNI_065410 [Gregarina niphandrodes]
MLAELKEHPPVFADGGQMFVLQGLTQLVAQHTYSTHAVELGYDEMTRSMSQDIGTIAPYVARNPEDDPGVLVLHMVPLVALDRYVHYHAAYYNHPERLHSACFSGLVSWKMSGLEMAGEVPPPEAAHFPVGLVHRRFDINGPSQVALRGFLGLEEQLVRRMTQMLIAEDAIETLVPPDHIERSVVEQKSFKFSISEEKFRELYERALDEIMGRAATEEAFNYTWRTTCLAVAMVYETHSHVAKLIPSATPTSCSRACDDPETAHYENPLDRG